MEYLPGTGGSSPDLDIVFVHGINPTGNPNHARDTWTHEDGTFWPEQLFPQLIQTARIFIFAYNSSVLRNAANAPVATYAESLLNDIKNRRMDENEKHRPLIFIAHSLGGLLVKQALIEAMIDERNYGCVKASTYGLVFFATPHLGGNRAGVADVAAKFCSVFTGEPTNSLLETLQTNSLVNEISSDQFSHQLEEYEILNFFESTMMDVKIKKRIFRTKLTSMYIVDRPSAKLSTRRSTSLELNRNHSTICKFAASEDPAYDRVSRNLKNMADEARRRRVECHHGPRRTSESNLINSNFFSNDVPGAVPLHFAVDEGYRRINLPRKSDFFRGRADLIKNIYDTWQTWEGTGQRRLCLSGLGGVGKTELSRDLADKLDSGHVIWLRATNPQSLQNDLETAALGLMHQLLRSENPSHGSSGSQDSQGFYFSANSTQYLLNKLKAQLRSQDAENHILLILDDLDGLNAEKRQELADDFCGKSVDLIYTTRDALMADPGMSWDATNISVPPLLPDYAVELLMTFAGQNRKGRNQMKENKNQQSDELATRAVVERLGPLPSAIIVGSHYLKDHLNLSSDGLERFVSIWDSDESRNQILTSRRNLVRYPYSIAESFAVSISRLKRNTQNDPIPDMYEHCLILLCLLSAMGVASLHRRQLHQMSQALRELCDENSTQDSIFAPYVRLNDETLVTSCIKELKQVSLLAEVDEEKQEEGSMISLNGLVRSAVGSGSLYDLNSLKRADLDTVATAMKESSWSGWYRLAESHAVDNKIETIWELQGEVPSYSH